MTTSARILASAIQPQPRPVDLLRITFPATGLSFYFANYDKMITIASDEYRPLAFRYEEIPDETEVGIITVKVRIDDGANMMSRRIHRQGLDPKEGTLELSTVYLNFVDPSLVIASDTDRKVEFVGKIDFPHYGVGAIELTASNTFGDRLTNVPRWLNQPQCSYVFGDPLSCAVNTNRPNAGIPEASQLAGGTYDVLGGGTFQTGNLVSGTSSQLVGITTNLVSGGYQISFRGTSNELQFRDITGFTSGTGAVTWTGNLPASCSGQTFDLHRPRAAGDNKIIGRVIALAGKTPTKSKFYVKLLTGVGYTWYADNYFRLGEVEFLTGRNATAARRTTIRETFAESTDPGAESGRVLTRTPLPHIPLDGDIVVIKRGCDKTTANCALFENLSRFGGSPQAPQVQAHGGEIF